jgi:hypothetical protein
MLANISAAGPIAITYAGWWVCLVALMIPLDVVVELVMRDL